MKSKYRDTEKRVSMLMKAYPETRNDDLILYARYFLEKYGTMDILTISTKTDTNEFETVSRARRRIQARVPELQADAPVQRGRKKAEEEIREEVTK